MSGSGVSRGSAYRGKTPQEFYLLPFLIQGGGGPRGGITPAPMWLVQNTHTIGAAHQTTEDGAMPQKHLDEMTEEGYDNCGQTIGGNVQPNRRGRGGTN